MVDVLPSQPQNLTKTTCVHSAQTRCLHSFGQFSGTKIQAPDHSQYYFHVVTYIYPLKKANITMENPPFEAVFPIENGRFSSLSCFRISDTVGWKLVTCDPQNQPRLVRIWSQSSKNGFRCIIWVTFYHSPGAKQRFDEVFGKGMMFLASFTVIVYCLPWEITMKPPCRQYFSLFPTTLSKSKLWFMEVSGCLVTLFGDYGMKKQFGVQADPL